jgi:hypothetical protein
LEKTIEIQLQELREKIANDIENAVIEKAGDSAHTLQQAANIARGKKKAVRIIRRCGVSAILTDSPSSPILSKDPRAALTAEGMTSSGKEPMMYFSTSKPLDHATYLRSMQWKIKKNEWVASGRPLECWACGEPMPRNRRGFQFHHRTYANLGNENLNDIVLLCADDHRDLEKEFKSNKKMTGISLESWTWLYISLTRFDRGLAKIKESNIAQFMGEFNE